MGVAEATLAVALIGTAFNVESQLEAKSDMRKESRVQKDQLRLKQQMESARARREARVRVAKMMASSGTEQVTSSAIADAIYGTVSSLEGKEELYERQTDLNIEAINYETSTAVNQADNKIAQSLGTFAADVFSTDFNMPESTVEPLAGTQSIDTSKSGSIPKAWE